jgi:hypothetical protein
MFYFNNNYYIMYHTLKYVLVETLIRALFASYDNILHNNLNIM